MITINNLEEMKAYYLGLDVYHFDDSVTFTFNLSLRKKISILKIRRLYNMEQKLVNDLIKLIEKRGKEFSRNFLYGMQLPEKNKERVWETAISIFAGIPEEQTIILTKIIVTDLVSEKKVCFYSFSDVANALFVSRKTLYNYINKKVKVSVLDRFKIKVIRTRARALAQDKNST